MRVAVLGAGGFVGYAFIREALHRGWHPVACWGSPGSLVNLARHGMELRDARVMSELALDDVDVVVNCAHPFGPRGGRSIRDQADELQEKLLTATRKVPLIHLSSISVYEPFGGLPPSEDFPCRPPRGDEYAVSKLLLDQALMERAPGRVRILRPTIIYGAFGRYWTDAFLAAFAAGAVPLPPSRGRVQPVLVDDLARLMADAAADFRPGILNVGGPEEIDWGRYFAFWADVAGGRLVEWSPPNRTDSGTLACLKEFARTVIDAPSLRRLMRPLILRVPDRARARVRRVLGRPDPLRLAPRRSLPGEAGSTPATSDGPTQSLSVQGASGYFDQDRLVDLSSLGREFPRFRWTKLDEVHERMRAYYQFRFTDHAVR